MNVNPCQVGEGKSPAGRSLSLSRSLRWIWELVDCLRLAVGRYTKPLDLTHPIQIADDGIRA